MMKGVFAILFFCLCAVTSPVQAQDDRLSEIAEKLAAYEIEAERLKNIGYSGPVLQKDFKTLAAKVKALKEELGALEAPKESASGIKIERNEVGGPSFSGNAVSQDVLAFSTKVALSGTESAPNLTTLTWQILDANGKPVAGVEDKITEIAATGGSGASRRILPIKGLQNGTYTVRFTHAHGDEREVLTDTFKVWQRARATAVMISLEEDPKKHLRSVLSDADFNAFILLDMVKGSEPVAVEFAFINRGSGKVIYQQNGTKRRVGDSAAQKSGLPVFAGTLPKNIPMIFRGRVTDEDGAVSEASAQFVIRDYSLTISAPTSLRAGSAKSFSIKPPKSFKAPLDVRVNSYSEGLVIRHDPGNLSGQVSGVTDKDTKHVSFSVMIVDADGRIGVGTHAMKINPIKKIASTRSMPKPPERTVRKPTTNTTSEQPSAKPRTSTSPSKSTTSTDFAAAGRVAFGEWMDSMANRYLPTCFMSLHPEMKKALEVPDAQAWGRAAKENRARLYQYEDAAEKELLKGLVQMVESGIGGDSDCARQFVLNIASGYQVAGLGNASAMQSRLERALRSQSGSTATARSSAAPPSSSSSSSRSGSYQFYLFQCTLNEDITSRRPKGSVHGGYTYGVCNKGAPYAAGAIAKNPQDAEKKVKSFLNWDISCSTFKTLPRSASPKIEGPTLNALRYHHAPSFFKQHGFRDCRGEAEVRYQQGG